MSIITQRLLNQQLAAPQFCHPHEVVAHLGAMQAQEYRLMRWAVAMRTKKPSYEAFRNDYDEGRIIRLHLLRGTWQLVSADDYWWMLDLCGKRGETVIRGWMSANKIEIPEKELLEIRELLAITAEELKSATKEDFEQALSHKGIHMDDHRLSYHIRFSELSGTLCSGDLHEKKATYALSSSKILTPRILMDRDEELSLLARKYYQSHSPSTVEDFVWWSGLTATDCRRAIDLIRTELHTEVFQGQEYLIHNSGRSKGVQRDTTLLLPSYDEYLIGYKSRHISVAPEHSHQAHTNNGIFYPVVAHNGVICSRWTPFKKDLNTDFFALDHEPSDLMEKWTEYQATTKR